MATGHTYPVTAVPARSTIVAHRQPRIRAGPSCQSALGKAASGPRHLLELAQRPRTNNYLLSLAFLL